MWFREFLLKYWIECFFGLIVTIITANYKTLKSKIIEYKAIKDEKRNKQIQSSIIDAMKPMLQELSQRSDSNDETFRNELNNLQNHLGDITKQLNTVTAGMLNVQGNIFINECKEVLRQSEPISETQYEKCMNDHNVYKSLGGNHDGDRLFELVVAKVEHQIKQGATV